MSPLENVPYGRLSADVGFDQLIIDEEQVLIGSTIRSVDDHIGFLRALAWYTVVACRWAIAGLGYWFAA